VRRCELCNDSWWVYVDPTVQNGVTYTQVTRCPCSGGSMELVRRLTPSKYPTPDVAQD